jgi:hypothetical protein
MPEPMPIGDILKEHRAKWPRLLASCEARASKPETRASQSETRAAVSETPSQDCETRALRKEIHGGDCETRSFKTGSQSSLPLSKRLEAEFGLGDQPTLRIALYIRIQLTCQTFGEPALLALREVCQLARRANRPGNYLAFAIVRRFRELGFLEGI